MSDTFRIILQSCQDVAAVSNHVRINAAGIRAFAESYAPPTQKHWLSAAPFPLPQGIDKAAFFTVLHSIAFSFWGRPKWTITYNDKNLDGFWGLYAVMHRAITSDIPLLDPLFLANMTDVQLRAIINTEQDIPLLHERAAILRQLGLHTITKLHNDFTRLYAGIHTADELLLRIRNIFPSFEDSATYGRKKALFYKRAQLLTYDLCTLAPHLAGTEYLTACADYKLPQVLHDADILIYHDTLSKKMVTEQEIPFGITEEIEIRANTVVSVDLIATELKKKHPLITTKQVNDALGISSQTGTHKLPYHRTRTTAY